MILEGNDSRYTQCKLTYAGGSLGTPPRFTIAWIPAWAAQRNNRIEVPCLGKGMWLIDEVRTTMSFTDVYELFGEKREQEEELVG